MSTRQALEFLLTLKSDAPLERTFLDRGGDTQAACDLAREAGVDLSPDDWRAALEAASEPDGAELDDAALGIVSGGLSSFSTSDGGRSSYNEVAMEKITLAVEKIERS